MARAAHQSEEELAKQSADEEYKSSFQTNGYEDTEYPARTTKSVEFGRINDGGDILADDIQSTSGSKTSTISESHKSIFKSLQNSSSWDPLFLKK